MKSIAILVGSSLGRQRVAVKGRRRPSAPLATYTLSGTVAEATPSGLVPVAGVLIRDDSSSKSATSDQNGMYNIAGLQAMNHAVLSSKRNPATSVAGRR